MESGGKNSRKLRGKKGGREWKIRENDGKVGGTGEKNRENKGRRMKRGGKPGKKERK